MPGPPTPPPPALRLFVPWELFLSSCGAVVAASLAAWGIVSGRDLVVIMAPCALIVGMLLHAIFMLYRVITLMHALITEVAPAMRNLSGVISGIFQGRTGQ